MFDLQGSARALKDSIMSITSSASASSVAGHTGGTPRWCAPELGNLDRLSASERRRAQTNPAVDIFSLGCMIGEVFLRQPPFAFATTLSEVALALSTKPPFDAAKLAELAPGLAALVAACCQLDPRKRPTINEIAFTIWPRVMIELATAQTVRDRNTSAAK